MCRGPHRYPLLPRHTHIPPIPPSHPPPRPAAGPPPGRMAEPAADAAAAAPQAGVAAQGGGAAEAQLAAGDRVRVAGMVAGPLARLNGHVGTLLELKPHGWHVRLDGRGKWLVQAAFLERPPGPRVDLRGCSSAGVVGTWDGWREAR
ncbi:unnamed protein product, partial [Prorocentrum cordatum]